MSSRTHLIAADTGGTFTDIAVFDSIADRVHYGKALTNYTELADGALDGLDAAGVDIGKGLLFKHGTTHVINAFVQRFGARTALIATRGFRDMLEIGRGNRPVPFSLRYRREPVLVPRNLRFEIRERIDARGDVLEPIQLSDLDGIVERLKKENIEAVAVSFLNAYANSAHERQAVAYLQEKLPGLYITSGTALSNEWFEYERTSTAVANAYVGPKIQTYMEGFANKIVRRGFGGAFYMMGSNGGVLPPKRTVEEPVALVESGPVGGCIGAAAYATALGLPQVIAFDMGGTTAKCALIMDGQFDVQPVYYVGGYERGFPLRTPVLDIIEVGAGGGSIAWLDDTDALNVGPQSAGSEPGPVAFGRGGTEPTVTDANLVLGRISTGNFMSGRLKLDVEASHAVISGKIAGPLGYTGRGGADVAAQGILDLATVSMANAIKEISIERGHDIREFALFVFGGSGPLFASVLARSLGAGTVVIPPHPGNFSSLGMLLAGARIDLARTVVGEITSSFLAEVDRTLGEFEVTGQATLAGELGDADTAVQFEYMLEMRYRGQKHTVRVPYAPGSSRESVLAGFEGVYQRRYGNLNRSCVVEILGARLGAEAAVPRPSLASLVENKGGANPQPASYRSVYFPEPAGRIRTPVWNRADLPIGFDIAGPAVVEEYSTTLLLQPGDRARVGQLGEITIDCRTDSES